VKNATPSSETPSPHWHVLTTDEIATRLEVDPRVGLSEPEVARRRAIHGSNQIGVPRGRSALRIFAGQFRSIIVLLLVVATALAFAMGERPQGFAVLGVIVINALIGFATEWSAERSLVALRAQTAASAHVVREGTEREIEATALVPGDVVVLHPGARVPADGRLFASERLQLEESALTGEPAGVLKSVEPLEDPLLALGDRRNLAYLGSTVTTGRGRMIVIATGAATEVGAIGRLLEETLEARSPLELKLAELGQRLVGLVLVLSVVIVIVGRLRGHG